MHLSLAADELTAPESHTSSRVVTLCNVTEKKWKVPLRRAAFLFIFYFFCSMGHLS